MRILGIDGRYIPHNVMEQLAVQKVSEATGMILHRRGLRAAMQNATGDDGIDRALSHKRGTIHPDAYAMRIEVRPHELVAVEIEDTSRLTPRRLQAYADVWSAFDSSDDWILRLLVSDRYGCNVREISLFAMYASLVLGMSPDGSGVFVNEDVEK